MYDEIIKLRTIDEDSSETFHSICSFEVITPDVPFYVTTDGALRNTEVLDYSLHRNYILKVVATDCGQRKSSPVFVNILVKEQCHNGWQDVPTEVSYTAGSGRKKIAENAQLRLCDKACTPEQLTVKVSLTTKHIGKGCDRDTYSITSQRKLCGWYPTCLQHLTLCMCVLFLIHLANALIFVFICSQTLAWQISVTLFHAYLHFLHYVSLIINDLYFSPHSLSSPQSSEISNVTIAVSNITCHCFSVKNSSNSSPKQLNCGLN